MTHHYFRRYGFRLIYESDGDDDWYEERCALFKYNSVNCAFSVSKGVYINRWARRCCKCPFFRLCFRQVIIRAKYCLDEKTLRKVDRKVLMTLLDLNDADERDAWRD